MSVFRSMAAFWILLVVFYIGGCASDDVIIFSQGDSVPTDGDSVSDGDDSPADKDQPFTDGDQPVDGDITIDGDLPVDGDLPIDGDQPVDGDLPIDGDQPVDGDLPIDGDQPVDGDAPDLQLAGEICTYGPVHADAGACVAGLNCIGAYANDTNSSSVIPCSSIQDCLSHFGSHADCAEGYCGVSWCAKDCEVDQDCMDTGYGTTYGGCCGPIGGSKACYLEEYCGTVDGDWNEGKPCTFEDVNIDAEYCNSALSCVGVFANSGSAGIPCSSVQDCQSAYGANSDCVNGYCGVSWCTRNCDEDNDCTDPGYGPNGGCCGPVGGGSMCYRFEFCEEEEFQQAGEPCPSYPLNMEYNSCAEDLRCLNAYSNDGFSAITCETDQECRVLFGVTGDCAEGYCGYSFCTRNCEEDVDCPDSGFGPDGGCCVHRTYGNSCYRFEFCDFPPTQRAGEPCRFGDIFPNESECADDHFFCTGLMFDGSWPVEMELPCTRDLDCEHIFGAGNTQCVNGYCGLSWCTRACYAEEHCDMDSYGLDSCCGGNPGEEVCLLPVLCQGEVIRQEGETCSFGQINSQAGVCADDLECAGIWLNDDTPLPCNFAADCEQYFGNLGQCIQGYCGVSWCTAACNSNSDCSADIYGQGACCQDNDPGYCLLPAFCYGQGTRDAGETCSFGLVHADAGDCGSGLYCIGFYADESSGQAVSCTSSLDCQNYLGSHAECANGYCGVSFCTEECQEMEDCDPQFYGASCCEEIDNNYTLCMVEEFCHYK